MKSWLKRLREFFFGPDPPEDDYKYDFDKIGTPDFLIPQNEKAAKKLEKRRQMHRRYSGTCKRCGVTVESWEDEFDGVYVIPGSMKRHAMYDNKIPYKNCPNNCGCYMIEHIDMEFKGMEIRLSDLETLAELVKQSNEIEEAQK